MLLHVLLSFSGMFLALLLSYFNQNFLIGFFHLIAWFLLWHYSVYFKKTLALGNILVSFLTASVIMLVYVSEYQQFMNHPGLYNPAFIFCIFYATFAFLVNLIREIIKDAEDVEGDKLINANTIPLKLGLKKTKLILIIISLFSTVLIFISLIRFYYKNIVIENYISLTLTLILSFLICLFFIIRINAADKKNDFTFLSNYIKVVLTVGIVSMIFLNI